MKIRFSLTSIALLFILSSAKAELTPAQAILTEVPATISQTVVSPDGRHLYVLDFGVESLAVYRRGSEVDDLQHVQTVMRSEYDSEQAITLDVPLDMVMSSDGRFIYVTNVGSFRTTGSVSVLTLDPENGRVSEIQVLDYGEGDLQDLMNPTFLALSHDGGHLYTIADAKDYTDSLGVMAIDPATGQLSHAQSIYLGGPGVARDVDVAPQGDFVYVSGGRKIHLLSVLNDSGLLELRDENGLEMTTTSTLRMAVSESHLYLANDGSDEIQTYTRNLDTGVLSFVESVTNNRNGVEGLNGVREPILSQDGQRLYVTGWHDDAIAAFAVTDTGTLDFLEHVDGSMPGMEQVITPYSLTFSPDEQSVYAGADGELLTFSLRGENSELELVGSLSSIRPSEYGITGRKGVLLGSENGDHVIVAGERPNGLTIAARVDGSCQIQMVQDLTPTLDSQVDYYRPSDLVRHDDLVVMSSTEGNQLFLFQQDTDTGELTLSQLVEMSENNQHIAAVTFSPDGKFLYAVARWSSAILTYRVITDPNPSLELLDTSDNLYSEGLGPAGGAVISPDGRHLYIAARQTNALLMFARDRVSGEIELLGTLYDQLNGVDGLNAPTGIVMSPEGNHVYVVSRQSNALVGFQRDSKTGLLTQRELIQNGVNNVSGLWGAEGLSLSPDGKHVYVVSDRAFSSAGSTSGGAVTYFRRDLDSGKLRFGQTTYDGTQNATALQGATAVATSADNQCVYTSGVFALQTFETAIMRSTFE